MRQKRKIISEQWKKTIKKILVIRLSSIGDLVLLTPALRCLREGFATAEISLLTKKKYHDLFIADPRINHLILFDSDTKRYSINTTLYLLKRLRDEKFDLVVDLHTNLRSLYFTRFISPRYIVRYKNRHIRRWMLVHMKRFTINNYTPHTIDLYLESLHRIGVPSDTRELKLFVPSSSEEYISNIFQQNRLDYPNELIVGMCPGANRPTKRWTADGYAQLANILIDKYHAKIILFGAKEDRELINQIFSMITHTKSVVNLVSLSLSQLAVALSRCQLVITNDTGPMHIATAMKTKVAVVFGPTTPGLGFAPLGDNHVVIEKKLTCRPCSLHGSKRCPNGHFDCMKKITADEVIELLVSRKFIQ